jgi:putative PIN family toxin of toxin-antitoxin system
MKVLIDANVFLSYLLSPSLTSTISTVVTACFTTDIEVLVPCELIAEITEKLATKRYFRERVPQDKIDQFIQQLTSLAELPPPLEGIASYGRDPKDDYLIAYGVVNDADYVVTGDADLLVLSEVGTLQIVAPANFLTILKEEGMIGTGRGGGK